MVTSAAYNRISKYLIGASTSPILVDVSNEMDFDAFVKHFAVGNISIDSASSFCEKDELCQWEKLINSIMTKDSDVIICGLDSILKLQGQNTLSSKLRQLIDIECKSKTIILTVGCSKWLNYSDPRLSASGKITIIDGEIKESKTLCFVTPGLIEPDKYIDGINELHKLVRFSTDEVVVITKHKSVDYPNSLYAIRDYESTYQILVADYPDLRSVSESFGTASEWRYLFEIVEKWGTIEEGLNRLGGKKGLDHAFSQFDVFNDLEKWYYLLSLKIFGANTNKYLANAARKSNTVKEFIGHIYDDILETKPKNSKYAIIYEDRKRLIKHLCQYPDVIDRYCKYCLGLGAVGLHYLTDSTVKEKETIIALLASHGSQLGRNAVMQILESIYPALSEYLQDYNYGNDLLNRYFRIYKFDKTVNTISKEMTDMVDEQSMKREYNTLLQPRSLIVDHIEKAGSILYFIDAMGAEYLSYLQSRFFANGFDFRAQIARCELPSITSVNKEFVNSFETHGCQIVSRKDLDNLKHEGRDSYDYQNTKLPIHIVRELEIIDQFIEHLKSTLSKCQKAYIISDHGSSRLAVIRESEIQWEVSEKGKHSGRCCMKSDIDEKPINATESNDFWCLANYDRFKGGRKALVEVHGGATIEEVTIPIIEISKRDKSIACVVKNDGPVMKGIKTLPILKLFVEKESDNVTVEIEGKIYKSLGCKLPYIHEFELSTIKRNGKYTMNVYCDDILISKGLEIEIANQGAREKSFF